MLSKFNLLLRQLLHWAKIDRAVMLGILTSLRGFVTGPITMLLIARHYSPQMQGYYYTFNSLLGLQVFVELGLSQVLIQFASHEWALLSLDNERRITGDQDALSRLVSIGRFSIRWYSVAGLLIAVFLSFGGYLFFFHSPNQGLYWATPWIFLCIFTGLKLVLAPFLSILEGCNQVSDVYGYRLIDGLLTSLAIWLSVSSGAELWTAPIATAVSLLWTLSYLSKRYRHFFLPFFTTYPARSIVSWKHELWPLQWRIALSWLSGYFCFGLLIPIIFRYRGSIAAGQMGMTWSLIGAVAGISSMWVLSRAPRFGVLIAKKEYKALDQLFFHVASVSLILMAIGSSAIWGMILLLHALHHPYAIRLLSPLPAGLFLFANFLIQIPGPLGIYLRAHKKEPYMGLSIVNSTFIVLATWLLGSRFGVIGIASGYIAIMILFDIPAAAYIWHRCRVTWHSDESDKVLMTETAADAVLVSTLL